MFFWLLKRWRWTSESTSKLGEELRDGVGIAGVLWVGGTHDSTSVLPGLLSTGKWKVSPRQSQVLVPILCLVSDIQVPTLDFPGVIKGKSPLWPALSIFGVHRPYFGCSPLSSHRVSAKKPASLDYSWCLQEARLEGAPLATHQSLPGKAPVPFTLEWHMKSITELAAGISI